MLERSVVSIEAGSMCALELHEMNRDTCFIKVKMHQIHVTVVFILIVISHHQFHHHHHFLFQDFLLLLLFDD